MRPRSGQAFLPDFLASVAIFGAITAVFLFSWNSVIANQGQLSDSQNMRTEARYTTTFLVSTSGYPEDWNSSNVEIPGFASEDNFLQHERIEEFSKLSYEEQKRLFTVENFLLEFRDDGMVLGSNSSIGGEPAAYIVKSSSDFSDVAMLHVLNSSETNWDLYWPSGSNSDQLEGLTARNVYNYTGSGEQMMEDLVSNSSVYETIIAESIDVDSTEIGNTDELERFVDKGGSFVHTESDTGLITDTFDLNRSRQSSPEAVVERVSPLLNSDLSVEDNIEFDDSNAAYDTPDLVYANATEAGAGCAACKWEIGSGSLFYISDVFSSSANVLTFDETDESLGLIYSFGENPVNANTVVPVYRDVLLNSSGGVRDVEMRYIVWE